MAMADQTLATKIKAVINGNLPKFQSGTVATSDLFDFLARFYGFNEWSGLPPPQAGAKVAGVSDADMQILLQAGQAIYDWLTSNSSYSSGTYDPTTQQTVGQGYTPASFTAAQLAPLRTQLQSILSSL